MGIFISYRRKGGSDIARAIQQRLIHDGYDEPFLDVDSLGSGPWDQHISEAVLHCTDFVPILDADCFNRMNELDYQPNEDWMILELLFARVFGKNVVPIILPGFEFPAYDEVPDVVWRFSNNEILTLHDLIMWLSRQQAIEYSHEHFEHWIAKFEGFLTSKRTMGSVSLSPQHAIDNLNSTKSKEYNPISDFLSGFREGVRIVDDGITTYNYLTETAEKLAQTIERSFGS